MISQMYSLICSSQMVSPSVVLDEPEIGLPPLFTNLLSSIDSLFESLFILK